MVYCNVRLKSKTAFTWLLINQSPYTLYQYNKLKEDFNTEQKKIKKIIVYWKKYCFIMHFKRLYHVFLQCRVTDCTQTCFKMVVALLLFLLFKSSVFATFIKEKNQCQIILWPKKVARYMIISNGFIAINVLVMVYAGECLYGNPLTRL